jgi:hypothetical protein
LDRPLIYPNELPMVEDLLDGWKAALYSAGYIAAATIGPSTGVQGLAISSTGIDLNVTIGTGSIYASTQVDATAYGTLGTDSNNIMKQGILAAPVTLTNITSTGVPATTGYSQYWLIEVAYLDADVSAIVPPYLNSANPLVPWAGANNLGGSQYTVRQGQLVVNMIPGTAAPTGSQTVPATTAGYTAIYTVLVAHGQTTVTSANWAQLSATPTSTPWFPNLEGLQTSLTGTRLLGVPQVFTTPGTATYTPTAGTTAVIVECQGAGGGGGGGVTNVSGNCAAGTSGNAGAYGRGRFTSSFSGVTVTIGAGGAGGVGANGTSGGTSSFGSLLSSPGGPAGSAGTSQTGSASGGNGNLSGSPTGANISGANGGVGTPSGGVHSSQFAYGGNGGSTIFGPGGTATVVNVAGHSAGSTAYGAGGGGTFGDSNGSTITAGAGAGGIVIVWEYA